VDVPLVIGGKLVDDDQIRRSVLVGSSPDRLADGFNQFVFIGERARFELRIELRAAHRKLEAASCGGNHDETTDRALVTK
jgi:hypothetical protein